LPESERGHRSFRDTLTMNSALYAVASLFIVCALIAVAWAIHQVDSVATVWLTLLIVVAAILQLVVMLRQTSILGRQDEILARRARLTCFAQTDGAQGLLPGSTGMSIRIAVVNDGTRGASAFHLYVRTVGAINYHKPSKWVSLDNQLYHRTIQTPLFANDTMWIKAFIVCYALADKNRELRYRIAYEDDATDWLPLPSFSSVPGRFRTLLESLQDTED
jgi:hypothetical protein